MRIKVPKLVISAKVEIGVSAAIKATTNPNMIIPLYGVLVLDEVPRRI